MNTILFQGLARPGLSCKPSVRAHDAKRDLALVLASDGLWDFAEEKAPVHRPQCFWVIASRG